MCIYSTKQQQLLHQSYLAQRSSCVISPFLAIKIFLSDVDDAQLIYIVFIGTAMPTCQLSMQMLSHLHFIFCAPKND